MNPILIKPSGERHSQVIVMGRPYADADARSYGALKHELRPIVAGALHDLRARYDVVVCEGAGSPAEINLRASDLTNMWLAREACLPALLVADIDRGGVFASLFGTLALLDRADPAHVAGFVINKFRGDLAILAPGLDQLAGAHRPPDPRRAALRRGPVDGRRGLAGHRVRRTPRRRRAADTLDVAVLRLRWMSNFTDLDALAAEPGVRVRFTRSIADVERADLVVVPGTKATVRGPRAPARRRPRRRPDRARRRRRPDPRRLRRLPAARRADRGRRRVRARRGRRPRAAARSRRASRPTRSCAGVSGRSRAARTHRRRRLRDPPRARRAPRRRRRCSRADDGEPDGCDRRRGARHVVARRARARRRFAARCSRGSPPRAGAASSPAPDVSVRRAERERRLDRLGDLIADHVDTDRLAALIELAAPPPTCPTIETGACGRAALRDHRRHRDPRHGRRGPPASRDGVPGGALRQPGRARSTSQALLDDVLDGARVVVCRILGGRRGWPGRRRPARRAAAARAARSCSRSAARPSPDAEMTALSTAPAGAVAQAGEYLRHGDVDNVEQLLRFLADTFLLEGYGFEPPHEVADLGVYLPGRGDVTIEEALARRDPGKPDDRRLLLPLAPPDREHRVRRRPRARRSRRAGGQPGPGVELHAAPRRRRTCPRARRCSTATSTRSSRRCSPPAAPVPPTPPPRRARVSARTGRTGTRPPWPRSTCRSSRPSARPPRERRGSPRTPGSRPSTRRRRWRSPSSTGASSAA